MSPMKVSFLGSRWSRQRKTREFSSDHACKRRLKRHASKNGHRQFFVQGCGGKKSMIGEQSSCDIVKTRILIILFCLMSRLFCFYGWFLSKAESIPQGIARIVWMILLLKIHALTQELIKSYYSFEAKQTNSWDWQTPRSLFVM